MFIKNLKKNIYFFLPFLFITISCNEGLAPQPEDKETGFGGTITFVGEWNPDINFTFLVVFDSLLTELNDFNAFNLKYLSTQIPNGISSYQYSSNDSSLIKITAGDYEYVAVIQSTSEEITFNRIDWFVSGIYYANGDTTKPGRLVIPENTFINNVNIICDFNNPPPQPPGRR